MDRRVKTLIGAVALFAVVIAAVLIGQSGGDDEPEESAPVTELGIEDLEEGEGPAAEAGDRLTVDYVGTLHETGEEFDNSYDRGTPLEVELGAGDVIPGFDQGLEGMKEGGKREITIPSDLGYGPQGQPPDIPPNSALVFEVELVSID